MKKTLLLCFIHGFQGGETTFGDEYEFTKHLRDIVAEELPKIDIKVLVYPKFETRGNLGECVNRFRGWLEEKVIDLEVAAGTPSPTIEPSVRTILIGHSMGGIVAAEAVISLTSDKPIYTDDGIEKPERPTFSSLMFPYVQGVLAFDTPYLGISPGVVAHGAEGHYNNAAAAASTLSELTGLGAALWGTTASTNRAPAKAPVAALPAPGTNASWPSWGKYAVYAGAAGAAAAGGAAAWLNRDHITEGWGWASSHLEFVSCLGRKEELKKRVAYMVRLQAELQLGFANLYTRLGKAAPATTSSVVGTVMGPDRTFCNVPSRQPAGLWLEAVNDKAMDETWAHMSMFEPKENPGYEKLVQDGKLRIVEWLQNEWYETSSEEKLMIEDDM